MIRAVVHISCIWVFPQQNSRAKFTIMEPNLDIHISTHEPTTVDL